jgi:hypothetical protein
MNLKREQGVTTVEMAIVALLTLVTLFGSIEIARAFFVYTTLEEATRRGARVAAVCQVNDPAIREIAALSDGGPASDIIYGLTTANIVVEYLDTAGNALGDPMGSYGLIRYVRVRIVGFTHQLLIPLFSTSFFTPDFETTLPAESLGVWPGGLSPC